MGLVKKNCYFQETLMTDTEKMQEDEENGKYILSRVCVNISKFLYLSITKRGSSIIHYDELVSVVDLIYDFIFADRHISAIHTSIGRSKLTGGQFLHDYVTFENLFYIINSMVLFFFKNKLYKLKSGYKKSLLRTHRFSKKNKNADNKYRYDIYSLS